MTSHGTNNQWLQAKCLYSLRNNCDYVNVYGELSPDRAVRNIPLSFSQITFKILQFAICLLQIFLDTHRTDLFLKKPGA